jgi:hypothetical protein
MRLPRLALTRIVSTGPRDYADAVRHMVRHIVRYICTHRVQQ